jgi:hypothetical protein
MSTIPSAKFIHIFTHINGAERHQFIKDVIRGNENDPRISNLLASIDMNDTDYHNKMKSTNIYFIGQQLRMFDHFVCNS